MSRISIESVHTHSITRKWHLRKNKTGNSRLTGEEDLASDFLRRGRALKEGQWKTLEEEAHRVRKEIDRRCGSTRQISKLSDVDGSRKIREPVTATARIRL